MTSQHQKMLSTLSSAKKATLDQSSKYLQHLTSIINNNSHDNEHTMTTTTTTNLIITGSLALLAALTIYLIQKQRLRSTQRHPKHPFPFLALPPELRLKIYTYFPPGETAGTKMYLVSKQINAEYIHHHATTSRIRLCVSAKNYTHPSSTSPSSSPPPQPLWSLPPTLPLHLQKATIHLTLTSPLLGYSSPRDIVIPSPSSSSTPFTPSSQFPLTATLATALSPANFPALKHVHLKIRAIPDPLWNPIWFWYHVSQALKCVKVVRKVSFEVEGWSPGQHCMERRQRQVPRKENGEGKEEQEENEEEKWTWVCERGHWMADDGPNGGSGSGSGPANGAGNAGEGVMAAIGGRARKGEWEFSVREFCMRILYDECGECVGGLSSE